MIKMTSPSIGLNDNRVSGHVRMETTWVVQPGHRREQIIGYVAAVADYQWSGRLKSVVINSHGAPGYLVLGEGFWKGHTSLFSRWAGKVDTIWMTSCLVASSKPLPPGDRLSPELPGEISNGYHFCRQIAMFAKAYVVAAADYQDVPNQKIPYCQIDSYEGSVMCFKPDGDLGWSAQYGMNSTE